LLLHGGPGMTHEYFESFADHLPPAGIQIIFYDQLGSYFSDQPDDLSLWQTERFVEELEEVRAALGLEDAYMLGNSWGGLLLMEYALKYPGKLKGLIISNMIADTRTYEAYVTGLRDELAPELVSKMIAFEAAKDYHNPEYQGILFEHFYSKHFCRVSPWPDALMRSFGHLSMPVYLTMMGPSEMMVSGNLRGWNRIDDLHRIDVPALVFGARYDTMNPEDMREVARRMPNARAAISDRGSHVTWADDPGFYFDHLIRFLGEVEAGTFDERD
jgi:proline iminopeptidase